jgi:Na+/proline symporter
MDINSIYATFALRFVAGLHLAAIAGVLYCHLDTGLGFFPTMISFLLVSCAIWLVFLSLYFEGSDNVSDPHGKRRQSHYMK